jgi:hypothetical protein
MLSIDAPSDLHSEAIGAAYSQTLSLNRPLLVCTRPHTISRMLQEPTWRNPNPDITAVATITVATRTRPATSLRIGRKLNDLLILMG